MTQQLEARAFAIWRYAAPRDWDVSYDEISDATELTYNQVEKTIVRKRWGGRIGAGRQKHGNKRSGHMTQKRRGNRFDENALDVVDLMS